MMASNGEPELTFWMSPPMPGVSPSELGVANPTTRSYVSPGG